MNSADPSTLMFLVTLTSHDSQVFVNLKIDVTSSLLDYLYFFDNYNLPLAYVSRRFWRLRWQGKLTVNEVREELRRIEARPQQD